MNAHERELLKLVNGCEIDCDEFYIHVDRLVVQPQKIDQRERDVQ